MFMGYLWGSFRVLIRLRIGYVMVTKWLSRGYWVMVTVVRWFGDSGDNQCWRAKRRCSLPRRRAPRVPLWALRPAGGCAPSAFGFGVIKFPTTGRDVGGVRPRSFCIHLLAGGRR